MNTKTFRIKRAVRGKNGRAENRKLSSRGIQTTIMVTFTVVSVSIMLILGLTLYGRFSVLYSQSTEESTQRLMNQTCLNLEDHLVSMRRISEAIYYNVVSESDIHDQNLQREMYLIYEANKDSIVSVALYGNSGSLISAEPVAEQKEDPNVTKQDWFVQAVDKVENLHFSTPHIQNLFDDATSRYYWVISLSRAVEITENGTPQMGVLLVDMNYSTISQMLEKINENENGQYYYLCDSSGKIIYHPKQSQILSGLFSENSKKAAGYKDGVFDETFEGEHRKIVVNTVSYTGWRLVGVIPDQAFTYGMFDIRYFIVILLLLMVMILLFIGRMVSIRISGPIMKLNDSVRAYEAGEKPRIYIGGSQETQHLGYSIQKSYEQIETLMHEIVEEQNTRRKSELDALQSQINPHFLYNTLDSITWMVEDKRNDDAVFMIMQLANLLRISLSKGRTIISVGDELQHARNYMNIQKTRYKDRFSVTFEEDPAIRQYCTVKLIVQPLLENAIYYGTEGMDEDGEIRVGGRICDGDLFISVTDNGVGMTEEEVNSLLLDNGHAHKHGSGVGLVNVHNRIRLLFGRKYGLMIESEPDEGTTVTIHLPAVPYTEENRERLEKGNLLPAGDIH